MAFCNCFFIFSPLGDIERTWLESVFNDFDQNSPHTDFITLFGEKLYLNHYEAVLPNFNY